MICILFVLYPKYFNFNCNQYFKVKYFTFFCTKALQFILSYSTSQFRLATYAVLSNHMWPVATLLGSAELTYNSSSDLTLLKDVFPHHI